MNEYRVFREMFLGNILSRSRTVRHKRSETGVSSRKLPLLKTGEGLNQQLQTNLDEAARLAWSNTHKFFGFDSLKGLFESWINALNNGLVDLEGYKKVRHLDETLRLLNPQYRLWEVRYHPDNPSPQQIDQRMNAFIADLVPRVLPLLETADEKKLAETLAFADREIDLVIHPWIDGCGRFATTLVMWLAARAGGIKHLPLFGPREWHYEAMKLPETHATYMLECLERGRRALA